jgi:hypothetical protein
MHAVTCARSARACERRFSYSEIEANISARLDLSVVTVRISVIAPRRWERAVTFSYGVCAIIPLEPVVAVGRTCGLRHLSDATLRAYLRQARRAIAFDPDHAAGPSTSKRYRRAISGHQQRAAEKFSPAARLPEHDAAADVCGARLTFFRGEGRKRASRSPHPHGQLGCRNRSALSG